MTLALLRKELWQHWAAFTFAAVLTLAGGSLVIGFSLARGQAGTPLDGYRLCVGIFGVLLAVVVCHRLVVLEYQARTQLFLEALPFSRWRMVAVKYALGILLIIFLMGILFLSCLALTARHDPVSLRFLAILGLRSLSYIWFAYSFFFVMGFLGRYRPAIYLVLFLAVVVLQEHSAVQFSRFGPLALVDSRFSYETEVFPWDALRETWLLALVCLVCAGVLALVREGSLAALLAEKMSHREKVFIAALLVGLLWTLALVDEKVKRASFDLPDAITESEPGVVIKVESRGGDAASEEAARELARQVASRLSAVREYLSVSNLPPVFITPRGDLDALRYERGELDNHHGLHVQANYLAPDWQPEDFLAWLLREELILASNARAKHESRRFVLDGFALFWMRRSANTETAVSQDVVPLRASYGTRKSFSLEDIFRWLSFREKVGDPIASAVACSGLETLERLVRPEDFRSFIRATLAVAAPKDWRALGAAGGAPLHKALTEKCGITPVDFFQRWQQDLDTARQQHRGILERLPVLETEVEVERLSGVSRRLLYSISIDPSPEPATVTTFYYLNLPPFDEEVDERVLLREQNTYGITPGQREVPGGYSRHQRFYYTGACKSAELRCDIISGWKRMTLP